MIQKQLLAAKLLLGAVFLIMPAMAQQRASAGNSGIAINAKDNARVIIQQHSRDPRDVERIRELEIRLQDLPVAIQEEYRRGFLDAQKLAAQPNASAQDRQAFDQLKRGDAQAAVESAAAQERRAAEALGSNQAEAAKWARHQAVFEQLYKPDSLSALAAMQRAVGYEPNNPLNHTLLGDAWTRIGRSADALKSYQLAFILNEKLATNTPLNSKWQLDLSISLDKIAGILEVQGEGKEALAQYQKSLVIREKLAASDPKNIDWQRDLSESLNKVAGILEAQGEREKALTEYQKSLVIREKLAASEPLNSQWKRDLSLSHNKIADILVKLELPSGERGKALKEYQKGLVNSEKVVINDTLISVLQREFSISYDKIADILMAQSERGKAQMEYQKDLMLAKILTKLDPSLNEALSYWSLTYDDIANAIDWYIAGLIAKGERGKALAEYQKGLAIAENLAASEPLNSQWQHDLSVNYEKVADLLVKLTERGKALTEYQKGLAIREKLATSDPLNSQWQRELSLSYEKVADILEAQGKSEKALAEYEKSLKIREKLANSDPKNSDWQIDLVVSYYKLGKAYFYNKNKEKSSYLLPKALLILEQLSAKNALKHTQKNWSTTIQSLLDDVQKL